jgi:hypothetical protein
VHEASTPATIADLKDMIGAFQIGLEQLGTRIDNRMDEISGRVDEITNRMDEQTNGLRKNIQQDLVTTGRTIHQHVVKELQQQKAGQGAYSLAELKDQGAEGGVLRSSGHTAQQLKEVGFSAQQLKESGFEDAEIRGAGYQETELAAAGLRYLFWARASPDITVSEEGLVATMNGSSWKSVFSDVHLTKGTHYVEVQLVALSHPTQVHVGVGGPSLDVSRNNHRSSANAYLLRMDGGLHGSGKSNSDKAGKFVQGDRVGVLVNLDDGSLLFFKNGQKHGPGYGAGSVKGPVVLMASMHAAGTIIKLLIGAARPAGY